MPRYRLRTLLIVLVALSFAMAITRHNVIDFQQARGSHPAELIGVFHKYCIVWLVAHSTSLVVAVLSRSDLSIAIAAKLFCVLSVLGIVANLLLPFGMM